MLPHFKYCIFTNIVYRRWGCHQNAGKRMFIMGSFCEEALHNPTAVLWDWKALSFPYHLSFQISSKINSVCSTRQDSPFQVQINFLSIITPPEEAYRCNSKRQNASRILPFSSLCSSLKLVRNPQKQTKKPTFFVVVVRFWYIYLNTSLITL